jgi:hypothetical protein
MTVWGLHIIIVRVTDVAPYRLLSEERFQSQEATTDISILYVCGPPATPSLREETLSTQLHSALYGLRY